ALRQVNTSLTLRNWLIGFYIVEYEQNGEDRAKYGERLIKEIANRIREIKGASETQLYRCKDFYFAYPQIFPTALGKLQGADNQLVEKFSTALGKLQMPSAKSAEAPSFPAEMLISRLSFSHF